MAVELRVASLTITSPDPGALAHFYADLLGGDVVVEELADNEEDRPQVRWAQVRVGGESHPFFLNVEFERAWQRPVWPAEQGEQFPSQHLDIWVNDLDEAQAKAEACCAVLAEHQFLPGHRVMLDPVGHPFCLFHDE